MNRETERQIKRLHKLADFIEANPSYYNQHGTYTCVVGLVEKLHKEIPDTVSNNFSAYYGISRDTVDLINWGFWNSIDKRFKSNNNSPLTPARDAVKLVRWLAEQKALDKKL